MKTVLWAITLIAVCFSFASCGGGLVKNETTSVEKDTTDTTSERKRLEEEIIAKQKRLDSLNMERQKKKDLVEDTKVKKPLHSQMFYQRLLEAFCCEHFNKGFAHERFGIKTHDMKYTRGSLRVKNAANRNENTDIITGVISYKYSYRRNRPDGGFKALVTDNGEGYFIVTFTREGADEKGHIKTIMDQPFVYDSEEKREEEWEEEW
ncbi:MAG: hypothetical protein IKX36_01360 [Prevotella sp.]|nr:hypothetical protein [Prevotella sp.]